MNHQRPRPRPSLIRPLLAVVAAAFFAATACTRSGNDAATADVNGPARESNRLRLEADRLAVERERLEIERLEAENQIRRSIEQFSIDIEQAEKTDDSPATEEIRPALPADAENAAETPEAEPVVADAPPAPAPAAPAIPTPGYSPARFYDELSAEDGYWLEADGYGQVWRPGLADSPDWRPYTNGGWGYAEDYGWTWMSNEAFGPITCHYGRWIRLSSCGWVWTPGYEWAPAWVSWRTCDDYVGWAPLPPRARWSVGIGIGGWIDAYADIGPDYYSFIPTPFFTSYDCRNVIVDRSTNVNIISITTNVTHIHRIKGGHHRGIRVRNDGPDHDRINGLAHRKIRRLQFTDHRKKARGSTADTAPTFLATKQINFQNPQPAGRRPKIDRRIDRPVADRGWNSISDRTSRLKTKKRMLEDARDAFAAPARRPGDRRLATTSPSKKPDFQPPAPISVQSEPHASSAATVAGINARKSPPHAGDAINPGRKSKPKPEHPRTRQPAPITANAAASRPTRDENPPPGNDTPTRQNTGTGTERLAGQEKNRKKPIAPSKRNTTPADRQQLTNRHPNQTARRTQKTNEIRGVTPRTTSEQQRRSAAESVHPDQRSREADLARRRSTGVAAAAEQKRRKAAESARADQRSRKTDDARRRSTAAAAAAVEQKRRKAAESARADQRRREADDARRRSTAASAAAVEQKRRKAAESARADQRRREADDARRRSTAASAAAAEQKRRKAAESARADQRRREADDARRRAAAAESEQKRRKASDRARADQRKREAEKSRRKAAEKQHAAESQKRRAAESRRQAADHQKRQAADRQRSKSPKRRSKSKK